MTRTGNIGVTITDGGSSGTTPVDLSAHTGALIGTAPDKDGSLDFNQPYLFTEDDLAKLGNTGTLPAAITDFKSQRGEGGLQGAMIYVIVPEGADENATLASVAGDETNQTGLWAFTNSLTRTGLKPGLISAPGWTHQKPAGAKNGVGAAFESFCNLHQCHAFLDLPDVADEAVLFDYIGDYNNRFLSAWYPHLTFTRGAAPVNRPPSAVISGLASRIELQLGVHHSVLNKPIFLAHNLSQKMNYGQNNSLATILGNKAINCIVRAEEGGLKAWGDETTQTSDNQFYSWAVSRILADITLELKRHIQNRFIGKPLNSSFYKGLTQVSKAYLDERIRKEEIQDALFSIDEAADIDQLRQQRKALFKLQIVPVPPARDVTIERKVVPRIDVPVALSF